jgi:hypothetical protein
MRAAALCEWVRTTSTTLRSTVTTLAGLGDLRDGERGQASGRWATEWLSVLCA